MDSPNEISLSTQESAGSLIQYVNLDILTISQVSALLENLNLGNFKAAFENNQVDGATLTALETVEEILELGVTIVAKAKILHKKVVQYRDTGVPVNMLAIVDHKDKQQSPVPQSVSSLPTTPIFTKSQTQTSASIPFPSTSPTGQAGHSVLGSESSSNLIATVSPIEASLLERASRAKSLSVLSAILQHSLCLTSETLASVVVDSVARIVRDSASLMSVVAAAPDLPAVHLPAILDVSVLPPETAAISDINPVNLNNYWQVVPDLWRRVTAIARAHVPSTLVSLAVLSAIREVCKTSNTASGLNVGVMDALVGEGMLEVVKDILAAHGSQSCAIAESLLRVFNIFSVHSESNRVVLTSDSSQSSSGSVHAVGQRPASGLVELVGVHSQGSETIAELGLRAVVNLAVSPKARITLASAGICSVVVDILRTHGLKNKVIAEAGFRAINNLVYENSENRELLCDHGICAIVTQILRSVDLSTASVAVVGLQVVCGLCSDSDSATQMLLRLGIVPAIQDIISVYSGVGGNDKVVEAAQDALDALLGTENEEEGCVDEAVEVSQAATASSSLGGGVAIGLTSRTPDLVADVQRPPSTVPVPQFRVPQDLNAASILVDKALTADSPAVIVECLSHPLSIESEVVAVSILVSISRLCDGSATTLAEFGSIGSFFSSFAELIRCHASSCVVAEKALAAVKFLCRHGDSVSTSHKPNAAALGAADICQLSVDLLQAHGSFDSEVALQGLCAIRNLTINPQNMLRLGSAGACSAVVDMMRLYGLTNVMVAEQALRAVVNLAINEVNRELLGSAGACTSVVSLLREHAYKHEGVAEQGLGAIVNLAVINSNRVILGSAGACDLVVDMLRTHVTVLYSNNEIAKQASLAVLNLAWSNNTNTKLLQAADAKAALQLLVLDNVSVTNEVAKKNAREAVSKLDKSGIISMFSF